jgi:hypothetical protein
MTYDIRFSHHRLGFAQRNKSLLYNSSKQEEGCLTQLRRGSMWLTSFHKTGLVTIWVLALLIKTLPFLSFTSRCIFNSLTLASLQMVPLLQLGTWVLPIRNELYKEIPLDPTRRFFCLAIGCSRDGYFR